MARHRAYGIEFKRQVVREYLGGGESLNGLAKRHDLFRNLIRIWIGKSEAGAFDEIQDASDLLQQYEGRIAALERLVERVQTICAEFPRDGYRRVTAQLEADGLTVNHKRVARLMRRHGLQVRPNRRHVATADNDHDGPIFPDLAKDMEPDGPDRLWVADIIPAFAGAGSTSRPRRASPIWL
jgi:transposase-like protein